MNTRIQIFPVLLCAFLLLYGGLRSSETSRTVPEFCGFMTAGNVWFFALRMPGPDGAGALKWVSLGDEFFGFRLERYDRTSGVLVLANGDSWFEIAMIPDARVQNAFSRDEALRHTRSLITALEEKTRRFITYCELPPDEFSSVTGKFAEGLAIRKKSVEGKGGRLHVVKAVDGLPLILSEFPLDFTRLPKAIVANLSEEDKASLNKDFIEAKLHHSYVAYLAHAMAGNLAPNDFGRPPQEVQLPPGYIGTSRGSK